MTATIIDVVRQDEESIMRIGYLADGPWAHEAFDKIINDDEIEIVFITVRYDKQDNWLIDKAKQYSIPIKNTNDINSEEYMSYVRNSNIDLLVSMSFNQIFKRELIDIPQYKSINCHAGKLPFYRGRNILNWALINDESEFGITVHYIDDGIDTGDIILQDVYKITDEDDYNTLLQKAYVGCADILYRAIKQIQAGIAKRIPQKSIDQYGFYCGMRGPGDEIIDWNQDSRDIFNFVRAICKPGPQAQTYINGIPVAINKVRYIAGIKSYKGIVGQVIGKREDKIIVKTRDTYVIVEEYECSRKLRIGDRLG